MVNYDQLPAEVKALYPWPGRDLTLRSGHRLHYLDEGRGDPLLMVHGNPTWSFYWRTLVGPLSADHRCVVPDHVGHGLSDKPRAFEGRLVEHIANLVELIDHLDLRRITLLVHDWGGPIGLGAALERPERVARLVIFNTSVFLERVPRAIRLARVPLLGDVTVGAFNAFVRVAMLRSVIDQGRLAGGVGRGYVAPYDSWEHRQGHLKFIRDIPLDPAHPTRPVIERLTVRVPAELGSRPTLLVWGDRDFVFTGAFLDQWRRMLPNAEVARFADAGHWVVEDAHERILPLVRGWMARHPLPPDQGSPTP